jgi:hypothetical protein
MSRIPTLVSVTILAGAFVAGTPALAEKKKSPIDPSCLMVCEKWVGDNCEKFVMKCKGDPGYPTATKGTQGTTSGTGGTAGTAVDSGNKGNQGVKGRPDVKGNAATKGSTSP